MKLSDVKKILHDDILEKIKAGEPIAGKVLPRNPVRIQIVGRGWAGLQARIIYRDQAPYYFKIEEVT